MRLSRSRAKELDFEETLVQRRSRIEFLEKMKRTISGWLNLSSAGNPDYPPSDVEYSSFCHRRMQLQLTDDHLMGLIEQEYQDIPEEEYNVMLFSNTMINTSGSFRTIRRDAPRATRYGYRQRSSLTVIPEERGESERE